MSFVRSGWKKDADARHEARHDEASICRPARINAVIAALVAAIHVFEFSDCIQRTWRR